MSDENLQMSENKNQQENKISKKMKNPTLLVLVQYNGGICENY